MTGFSEKIKSDLEIEAEAYLYQRYQEDPVFFVEHALGHLTWKKQREILESVRDHEWTAVRACHGASKTFTAAEITVWFLNCFPNSKVITSAPTFSQVKNLLWAEINAIYKNSRIELDGHCMVTQIKTDQPDRFAFGFSTDKPARAEGWHAPEILFIFDEAKGIAPWLWDSVEGLMTGGFIRWLIISTTDGVQVGEPFYRAFMEKGSEWNRIHIQACDTPYFTGEKFQYINVDDRDIGKFTREYKDPNNVTIQIASPRFVERALKRWGKDSVLFLTKIKGEICDQASDTIIKLSQVIRMFENSLDPDFDDAGQIQAGVDVARGGADDTVFFKRKGLKIIGTEILPSVELSEKKSLVDQADKLCEFVDFKKFVPIKIDDTGVGGGLTDIMESRGYTVVPVNFQSKANSEDDYPNVISEMWFTVASIIQEISCPENEITERLQIELVNRKNDGQDNRGRRVVESKKRYRERTGFQSPDMADAFLLAFYERTADDVAIMQSEKDFY